MSQQRARGGAAGPVGCLGACLRVAVPCGPCGCFKQTQYLSALVEEALMAGWARSLGEPLVYWLASEWAGGSGSAVNSSHSVIAGLAAMAPASDPRGCMGEMHGWQLKRQAVCAAAALHSGLDHLLSPFNALDPASTAAVGKQLQVRRPAAPIRPCCRSNRSVRHTALPRAKLPCCHPPADADASARLPAFCHRCRSSAGSHVT